MRFPEAVDYLLAYHGRSRDSPDRDEPVPRPKPPPPREKPPFVLPPANPDQRRVFAYLQKRGIAPKVIRTFMNAGLLYEDSQYHNCVFVGRDGSGQPRFASKRGTCDLGGSSFKRDVLGSDKKVGFRLPCDPEIEEVAVFEAPIDLMSFCTLCPEVHSNAVALCGLYSGPLDTYLKDHPHLKSIKLLLDSDEPGIRAAKEMRERYREAGYEVEIRVPKYGKDWNAQLVYKLTGVLEEVKKPQKNKNPTQKEESNPMANLGKIISDKSAADAKWRQERKTDKETAAALRDTSVTKVTSDPEKFARYEPRTYQDLFKRCVRQAGIKDANFHALRHTFATRSLEQGMDVVTLSRLLGHANPSITMDKYGHALDDHKRASIGKLGGLYAGAKKTTSPKRERER